MRRRRHRGQRISLQAFRRSAWPLRLVAAALTVAALALLAATERGVRAHVAALDRHGGAVRDLGAAAQPSSRLYGYMVRVTGTPQVVELPLDADFGVQADTPVLIRHVAMFQWHEINVGYPLYEQDWVNHAVDSATFSDPRGRANPGPLPIPPRRFIAPRVRLDGFLLDAAIVDAIPGSASLTPDFGRLPPNLAATFHVFGDALASSTDPRAPRLGDLRIRWREVPLQPISVFARAEGDRLVPARPVTAGSGFVVQLGDRSLADLLPDVPDAPAWSWARRLLALLLTVAAVLLLTVPWPRLRRDPLFVIPAALAPLAALAGMEWLRLRTGLGVGLLLLAAAAAAAGWWRAHRIASTPVAVGAED